MKKSFISFFAGFIFSLGLGLSGMTNPQNVIGFLDIFGQWNPMLMFVMFGAITTHFIFIKFVINKKSSPIFALKFRISDKTEISKSLILGAFIFGAGWGLAGYCPGPAIVALASLNIRPVLFVISMIFGMRLLNYFKKMTV